jgi:D-alanine-D-alanine ligase-like ATP-grasp enzyme
MPGWLARRFRHTGANDLLANLAVGDYYVEDVETAAEFRIHVFDEVCIRVGERLPRVESPHPKFRSWAAGWKLLSGPDISQRLPRGARPLAKRAVAALERPFGAVDLAIRPDGRFVVWEVNSAPGLEGGTVNAYAAAVIRRYAQ